jgi:hypothetical protein
MGSEDKRAGTSGEQSLAGAASCPSEFEPLTSEELAAIRGAQSLWCKSQYKFEGSGAADCTPSAPESERANWEPDDVKTKNHRLLRLRAI